MVKFKINEKKLNSEEKKGGYVENQTVLNTILTDGEILVDIDNFYAKGIEFEVEDGNPQNEVLYFSIISSNDADHITEHLNAIGAFLMYSEDLNIWILAETRVSYSVAYEIDTNELQII